MVLRDIGELWELSLDGFPVAAVQDPLVGGAGGKHGLLNCARWGIPPTCACFNAGVLVIDLERWCGEKTGAMALDVAVR